MEGKTAPAGLLQAFFASCPEMVFIAGAEGRVLWWSDALGELLGPAVTQGTAVADLAHAEDRGLLASAWARLPTSAAPAEFELRLRTGRGVHVRLLCTARRSPEGGEIFGSLRRVVDVSVAAAKFPNLKERLLDGMASHMDVCLWAIDREGIFLHHDGKGIERAGLKRGQWLGMSIFELYGEGQATDEVRRALGGEAIHGYATDEGIEWENWFVPMLGGDGRIEGVMGFTLDVSEARNTAEELRVRLRQIEKQQEVIRNLSTPIIEVWNGVLTLPMVGVVDSVRTAEVMDALLSRIVEQQARFAILDLTGVEVVDTQVASHLIQLITAIGLLGAEGIVVGIKPNVAQTIVALGLDLSQIVTQRNLRAALSYCIRRMSAPGV